MYKSQTISNIIVVLNLIVDHKQNELFLTIEYVKMFARDMHRPNSYLKASTCLIHNIVADKMKLGKFSETSVSFLFI